MDYSVNGILQTRILEWVAFPLSKGSPPLRDQTQVSCTAGRFFTSWATREAQEIMKIISREIMKISCATTKAHHSQINKLKKKDHM